MIITETLQVQPVLRLQPHPVSLMLAKTREAATGLPLQHRQEVLNIISSWETIFFNTYRDGGGEKAAHALLYFRLNNIEYIMLNYAQGDLEKLKWLKIYNEIKTIVKSFLPPNIDLEDFIRADTQKLREVKLRVKVDQAVKEMIQSINLMFSELEDRIYKRADRVNEALQADFEAIQREQLELCGERTRGSEGLYSFLNRVTQTVLKIHQTLNGQLKESKELGEKLQKHEQVLAHLLDECEAMGRL